MAKKVLYDSEAASYCIDYILEHEVEDYHEQAAEHGVSFGNWKEKWDSFPHIFVDACKAVGITPDEDDFGDDD